MAAAPPPAPRRLDTVLSFSDAPAESDSTTPAFTDAGSDSDSDTSDAEFEFAFAPLLSPRAGGGPALAPADDLFAHGRIVAAYPLFDRQDDLHPDEQQQQQASTAPPSPDTYCAWAAPRSAPGSPSRRDTDADHPSAAAASAAFPKSSSTGEARRFCRLRDLVGGRSHSDGKEKFVFLQSSDGGRKEKQHATAKAAAAAAPLQKQGKKKMDMATAHRLFYGNPGAAALAGGRPRQQKQSFLPYRPGIVGFFASTHAFGHSHHPY